MKIQKKGIAVLLGFVLFLSFLNYNPAGIYAEGETAQKGKIELLQGSGTGDMLNLQVHIYEMDSFAGLKGSLTYDRAALEVTTGSAITIAPYKQGTAGAGSVNFKADLTRSTGTNPDTLTVESSGTLSEEDLKTAQGDGFVVTIPFTLKNASSAVRTISLSGVKVYIDAAKNDANAFTINDSDIAPFTVGMGLALNTEDVTGSGLVRVPLSIKEVGTGVIIDNFVVSVSYDPKVLRFSYDSSQPGKDAVNKLANKISVQQYSDNSSEGMITMTFLATPSLEGQDNGEFIQLAFRPVNEVTATQTTTVKITLTEVHSVIGSAGVNLDKTTLSSNVTLTPLSFTLGDVDGDKQVSLVDALLVLKEIQNRNTLNTNIKPLEEDQKRAADVDQDGYITLLDVTWIMEYYNGIRKSFAEIR